MRAAALMMAGLLAAACDAPEQGPDAGVAVDAAADVAPPDAAAIDAAPDAGDVFVPGARDAAPPDPDVGWPEGFDLRALLDAYEAGELTLGALRAALRDAPPEMVVDALPDPIDRPVLYAGRGARVDGARVTADGILVLGPGARLSLAAGAGLVSEGRLYAIGSPDAPVRIEGDGYDTVELRAGPNGVHHTALSGGDRLLTVSHPTGVRTEVAHADFDRWVDVAVDLPGTAGVTLRDGRFGLDSAPDVGGEIIRARRSGGLRIEGNVFGPRRGYRDAIDLQDCVGEWPVLVGNAFAEGEDDAIDLDRCSAYVIGNHIRDFYPLDPDRPNAGINGGGITGDGDIDIVIVDNVIEGCFHGIGFKNGARPVMINNTIVGGHIGVSLYQSAVGQPMPHGVMVNNLLADNRHRLTGAPQDIVLDGRWWPTYNREDPIQATLDAAFNTLASGGALPPGEGNDGRDPMLERVDGLPAPTLGSPAVDSGTGDGFPADVIEWLRVDVRGHARSVEGDRLRDVDRGAVER